MPLIVFQSYVFSPVVVDRFSGSSLNPSSNSLTAQMQKGSWTRERKTQRQPTQMTQIESSRHKQEKGFENMTQKKETYQQGTLS